MESTKEYRVAIALWKFCPPFLLVLGTFGNVMTVVILRRLHLKRSAMPVYLTALAVSDTCLLYTGLLRRWLVVVFELDVRTLNSSVCKLHTWLVHALFVFSAWVLGFMTVERTLCVWRPHHVTLLCTRTKAIVIVFAVVVCCLLVYGHMLYGVDLVTGSNGARKECFVSNPSYLQFFQVVWSWADLTLASLLPFLVLLLGNTLILCRLSLAAHAARNLGSVTLNGVSRRRKTVSSLTVTLVALSVVFFLTTSPVCVYNVMEHYVQDSLDGDPVGLARMELAWVVVNILMYVNCAVNFYLYCLSGAKFRKELKEIMCCRARRSPVPRKTADDLVTVMANLSSHNVSTLNLDRNEPPHDQSCSRDTDSDSKTIKRNSKCGQQKLQTTLNVHHINEISVTDF